MARRTASDLYVAKSLLREKTYQFYKKYSTDSENEACQTYLLPDYIDFKKLPIALNKYILSFVYYGDILYKFVEQYANRCFKILTIEELNTLVGKGIVSGPIDESTDAVSAYKAVCAYE